MLALCGMADFIEQSLKLGVQTNLNGKYNISPDHTKTCFEGDPVRRVTCAQLAGRPPPPSAASCSSPAQAQAGQASK